MRSGGRSNGGVSEQGRRIDQTHKREASDGPCAVSMTSLNLPERMNELSEGDDPPVQWHEGGETWIHIGNSGQEVTTPPPKSETPAEGRRTP